DHETGYLTGPDAEQYCDGPVCEGVGVMPSVEWHSGGHTNQLVPFYARGTGAEFFEDVAIGPDPIRGPYIDNTFLGSIIMTAMQ
ncbi:MAG: alkaline phosphatase, partial [Armatimonadota bacterium]